MTRAAGSREGRKHAGGKGGRREAGLHEHRVGEVRRLLLLLGRDRVLLAAELHLDLVRRLRLLGKLLRGALLHLGEVKGEEALVHELDALLVPPRRHLRGVLEAKSLLRLTRHGEAHLIPARAALAVELLVTLLAHERDLLGVVMGLAHAARVDQVERRPLLGRVAPALVARQVAQDCLKAELTHVFDARLHLYSRVVGVAFEPREHTLARRALETHHRRGHRRGARREPNARGLVILGVGVGGGNCGHRRFKKDEEIERLNATLRPRPS